PLHVSGSWAVGTFHSTATLSSEGTCSLCELRLMHCLNIFLSRHGHSGWVGLVFCWFGVLTLTLVCVFRNGKLP
ncbi:hypothetical protein DFJ58DRAFT_652973, partial [Suillus subalutaceus]|uniref:uncharacterized protein n=1 Tax=Suillus subalutaceus TaxID=48586 RepID=UPI001B8726D0